MDTIYSHSKLSETQIQKTNTEIQYQSLPAVILFLCSPEIPCVMESPIMMYAQIFRLRIYNSNTQVVEHKNWNIAEKNTTIDKAFNMHDSVNIAIMPIENCPNTMNLRSRTTHNPNSP